MMTVVRDTCDTLKRKSSKEFEVNQYKPIYAANAKQIICAT
jgi:hypothetical protein